MAGLRGHGIGAQDLVERAESAQFVEGGGYVGLRGMSVEIDVEVVLPLARAPPAATRSVSSTRCWSSAAPARSCTAPGLFGTDTTRLVQSRPEAGGIASVCGRQMIAKRVRFCTSRPGPHARRCAGRSASPRVRPPARPRPGCRRRAVHLRRCFDTARRSAPGRCLASQVWHCAQRHAGAPARPRCPRASCSSAAGWWRNQQAHFADHMRRRMQEQGSSERVTTPLGGVLHADHAVLGAAGCPSRERTSSKLAQWIRSAAPPKYSTAALLAERVPSGPSTADPLRRFERQAGRHDLAPDRRDVQALERPAVAALHFSITCATRSGRKYGVPSRFLTSPTCSATCARWFRRSSNCASSASIPDAQVAKTRGGVVLWVRR